MLVHWGAHMLSLLACAQTWVCHTPSWTNSLKLGTGFERGINRTSVPSAIQRLCCSVGNSYSKFPLLLCTCLISLPDPKLRAQKGAKETCLLGMFSLLGCCQDHLSVPFEVFFFFLLLFKYSCLHFLPTTPLCPTHPHLLSVILPPLVLSLGPLYMLLD